MFHIQWQGYVTPILDNITMHTYPTCIIHRNNFITWDTNLGFWIIILLAFFISLSMCYAISQLAPSIQCFLE
jgi:hypothetical protein